MTINKLAMELVSQNTTFDLAGVFILVMDEASMTAVRLFSHFLEIAIARLPNLQGLYLIGDVSQLDSVEAGTVLKDMTDTFPAAFLDENFRVTPESRLIHENAVKIKNQQTDIKIDPKCFTFSPFSKILYNDLEATIKAHPDMTPWNTHFISPYREEARNIGCLAKQFLTGKIHAGGVYHVGDKILCTKNFHSLGVINGDFFKICEIRIMQEDVQKKDIVVNVNGTAQVGSAISRATKLKCLVDNTTYRLERGEWIRFMVVPASFTNEDKAEMDITESQPIDLGNGPGKIPFNAITLGYCTTNHQFQGCEADYIVFDLRKVTYFVNWKQVYTGVTRAKKRVIILGDMNNLVASIGQRVYPRRSKLFFHLENENQFIKSIPKIEEKEEDHLLGLLKAISVDDSENSSSIQDNNKRPAETSSGYGNKKGRY